MKGEEGQRNILAHVFRCEVSSFLKRGFGVAIIAVSPDVKSGSRPKRRDFFFLFLFVLSFSLFIHIVDGQTLLAHAAINPQINYQAKLTDSSNVAVADGNYLVQFRLYTSATSATTTAIWEEIRTATGDRAAVTDGLFSLMLGSTTPLTSVNFNQTLYLGVEICGTSSLAGCDGEMTPRKILGAVPAAMIANAVSGSTTPSSFGTTTPLANTQVTIEATTTTAIPFSIRAAASQAANLFNIQNSAGADLLYVSAGGGVFASSTLQATGLATLYGGLLVNNATSTITNLTMVNATSTNATTTNLYASGNITQLGKWENLEQELDMRISDWRRNNYMMANVLGISHKDENSQLVTLSAGNNYIHGLTFARGYIWGVTATSPGRVIRFNPDNLDDYSVTTFDSDGFHNSAVDLLFSKEKDRLYIIFGSMVRNTIVEMNPVTLSYADVVSDTTNPSGTSASLSSDGSFLYVLTNTSPTKIIKYSLTDFSTTNTASLTDLNGGHALRFDGTNLYASSASNPAWIARITPSSLAYSSQAVASADSPLTDDLTFSGDYVYLGPENTTSKSILRVNKSTLAIEHIYTNISAASYGVFFDGRYIISLHNTSPGTMVRLDPQTLEVKTFTFPTGANSPNEVTTDGQRYFVTFYLSPAQIERVSIPALNFGYHVADLSSGTAFILDSSGRVGIATTSPNWELSVAGRGSFDNFVRASYFTATSTTVASTFPYASTTALSVSGTSFIANGTAAVPSFAFTSDNDTGIYRNTVTGGLDVADEGVGVVSFYNGATLFNNIALSGISTLGATGLATLSGGILVNNATSTITNLVMVNATSTNATTTNIYVSGQTTANTISASGLATLSGGILVNNATSTITNLVMVNATSTNATTTNIYVSGSPTIGGGLAVYSAKATSTIPNNTPFAWTIATSTTAAPLFRIDSTSGSEQVVIGSYTGDVTIGDTGISPNLVFVNNATIKGNTGQTITVGAGSDIVNFAVNTGFGSSSPWRTLSVVGTVAFDGLTATSTPGNSLCLSNEEEVTLRVANTCAAASSRRFKRDIEALSPASGLAEVMAMNPVSFNYTPEYLGSFADNPNWSGQYVGFVAEDLQKIDPRLVTIDADGQPETVRYQNLTAVLTKAIQELNVKVESLASTTEDLRLLANVPTATIAPDISSSGFFDNLFKRVGDWLADATNGIKKFFAAEVHTGKLCVSDSSGETCIDKSQLDAILLNYPKTTLVIEPIIEPPTVELPPPEPTPEPEPEPEIEVLTEAPPPEIPAPTPESIPEFPPETGTPPEISPSIPESPPALPESPAEPLP